MTVDSGVRVLIVEDDQVDRKLLERLLAQSALNIADQQSVGDLQTALQLVETETFDIILSDLGLPDSAGIKAADELQRAAPDVPLIVLSNMDDEATTLAVVQLGVQDYLVKGQFDSNVLARAIRYAIERKKAERTLQEAEQRYRTIFENSAVAIMVVDAEERLSSWNTFTENLFGMSHEDLHQKPIKSFYPEEEWQILRSRQIREKGVQQHLETRMIKKDGRIIDVDVSLSALKDRQGKVRGSIGIIHDITERKEIEEALRKSEERFRQVVENAEEWIWEVDAKGLFTYLSPVVERILGVKPEDMLGKTHFYDLFHPEERDRLKKRAFEVFARRDSFREFETKNLDREGNVIWLSKSGVPILDEEGNLMGYRGVDVDITERRHLHEVLDRKQRNLEAIFDAAPIAMLLIDEHMRVRRANDAVRTLAGKDYAEIVNQLPGFVLGCVHVDPDLQYGNTRCGQAPECTDCVLFNTIKKSVDSGLPVHGVETQPELKINGRLIQPSLSISAEPVIIDGTRYAVVALHDVTDRTKAEKELRETMEIKSQFISTVSHELRTPLASMKEAVLIVLDGVAGEINDDQKHFLDLAKRNIDRLWRLINDVLDFQKLGSSKMDFQMEEGDLGKVLEDAHSTMIHFANKCKVRISLDIEPDLPEGRFDTDRIIQVLTNLISNAIKFTPPEGCVSIRLNGVNDEFVIQVQDSGMGIPPEALGKIFDRFYRVKRPGKTIKGTGLGLAIVKRIIGAHGGRVEVASEVEKGTTFTVHLPITHSATEEVLSESGDIVLENAVAAE